MEEVKDILDIAGNAEEADLDEVEDKTAEIQSEKGNKREIKKYLGAEKNEDVGDIELSEGAEETAADADRSREALGETVKYKDGMTVGREVKMAVLARDSFTCQCCKNGGKSWLSVLVVHHKVPNACGGPNTEAFSRISLLFF